MKKFSSPFILLLCSIITVFYFIGVLFFLSDYESDDKCEMTYMFEYPQFVRVSQKIDLKYPKYGLYAYGEGRTTKKARNMYFDGIPVLFIPGNAGSHQQVRSLSSVALRKALNSGSQYHFDYFTVDLSSEYSALYGPVLYDQLEYVLNSIERILELYQGSPSQPKQIVLIGHSVGGIVAKKAIVELLKNKRNLISILIALAAPIKRAPLFFDKQISQFYKASSFDKEENALTVSIAGGYSDFLVPSYLAETEGNNTLNLVATNIPKAWVESNHVQIVWCKQIVLAINRALFDSVDRRSQQISTDIGFLKRVFQHHLVYNSGTENHLKPDFQKFTKISYKGEWIESILKQYSVEHKKGLKQPHWYMAGFTALPTYEILTVLAVNLEVTDWIFVCNAAYPNGGSRVCVDGEHLTQYSEIIPTNRYKRRLVTINMNNLRKNNTEYSHVVFRALPTSEPVTFHVDIYGSFERTTEISLPRFFLTKQIILSQTPEKALVYDIILPELENLLQVYQLFVEPVHCSSDQHHATASLILPWASENVHSHFTEVLRTPFIIRLQNAKPINASDAKIRLTLDPSCTYRVSVRLHVAGIFGQIARYYSPFLITSLAVVFLLGFQTQINHMGKTGNVPIFFTALLDGLKQSWIVPVVYLLSRVSYPFLINVVPQSEFVGRLDDIVNVLALLVMFASSIIILLIIVATYFVSLFLLESTAHKLTLKLLARTLTIRFSDYFMIFLQKVPFIVAAVLVGLCLTTCGGLALCVGMLFYFLKLTQMSQDYIEQATWFIIKILSKKYKEAFSKNKNNESVTEQTPTVEESMAVENQEEPSVSYVESDDNVDVAGSGENQKEDNTKQDLNRKKTDTAFEETTHSNNDSTIQRLQGTEITNNLQNEENIPSTEPQNKNKTERLKGESDESGLSTNLASTNNAIFFHSSMFFMWVFVAILNVPAVLTWAHNFKYSKHLIPDESFLSGLVLSISAFPLWQLDLPRTDRKFTRQLRIMILGIIVISLLYATISVYRLNYMLTILFALVVVQQCYAPKICTENEEVFNKTDDEEIQNKYDEVKMKID